MRSRTTVYWILQLSGWGGLILLNILNASFNNRLSFDAYLSGLFLCISGIIVSHVYREISRQLRWTELGILALLPRVLLGAVASGFVYTLLYGSLNDLLIPSANRMLVFGDQKFFAYALNFSFLFLCWNILYFAVHIFENYKKQEINTLRLQAALVEIELSSIKAQMNPHFMFNALNSIRALIDEDPLRAKEALTALSGTLRSILVSSRKQLIPFREELGLVEKYLALEKIRFEERLLIEIEVDEAALDYPFPPLMLQTVVENGLKHGIARLKTGGLIRVKAHISGEGLLVEVINSGVLGGRSQDTGIGIPNTEKRLKTLFGQGGEFKLSQSGDYVIARIIIPYRKHYESTNH